MRPLVLFTSGLLTTLVAGQGLLSNGNSVLPACAQTCQLLNQAASACGGTSSADQGGWSCFCQSGYLRSLYQSDTGICDAYCTNPSDSQQVSTWFKSNCGSDNGASEHAGTGTPGSTTTVVVTSTSTGAAPYQNPTNAASSAAPAATSISLGGSSGISVDNDSQNYTGPWWPAHWKWVVMLIALLVGLLLLAALAVWLKRRHDRKMDRITGGFNAGITHRSGSMNQRATTNAKANASGSVMMSDRDSGRNTPAPMHEAFMPYGYGYTRSESRLGSGTQATQNMPPETARAATKSPLSQAAEVPPADTAENEKGGKRAKRVLVKERTVEGPDDITDVEKGVRR